MNEAISQKIDAATDLEAALEIASNATLSVIEGVEAYKLDSRHRLDSAIALTLAFGQRWLYADDGALVEAYQKRQILSPPAGGNPWLQIIYLVTGAFDPSGDTITWGGLGNQTKFIRRAFLNKYAGALRYLNDNGVSPKDVASTIAAFDQNPFGKRLNGMLAKDRADNDAKSRNLSADNEAELLKAAQVAMSSGETAPDSDEIDRLLADWPPVFTLAWGVIVEGKFYPGGHIDKSDGRARKLAISSVKGTA